jgi:hypothetical protein
MCVSPCSGTKSNEISKENLTFTILNAVSTDNRFIDPFLHIIIVEEHFDVMITLNVHTVREKTCLVTKRHADRRGKPFFFTHAFTIFSGP